MLTAYKTIKPFLPRQWDNYKIFVAYTKVYRWAALKFRREGKKKKESKDFVIILHNRDAKGKFHSLL